MRPSSLTRRGIPASLSGPQNPRLHKDVSGSSSSASVSRRRRDPPTPPPEPLDSGRTANFTRRFSSNGVNGWALPAVPCLSSLWLDGGQTQRGSITPLRRSTQEILTILMIRKRKPSPQSLDGISQAIITLAERAGEKWPTLPAIWCPARWSPRQR